MKRKIILLAFFIFSPLLFAANDSPSALLTTWSQFQTAVKNDDVDKVASLTHYPFKTSWHGTMKTPASFKKKYKEIFTADVKHGIEIGKIEKVEGVSGYAVYLEGMSIYIGFKRFGDKYLFYYFENPFEDN